MAKLQLQPIINHRLGRQGLLEPISNAKKEEQYITLFRQLQPVAPVHFSRPGDPPKLVHRTSFDDFNLSSRLREQQKFVKGRFLGGRVGYVFHEDLERYARIFRKKIKKVKPIFEEIMLLIHQSGGISKEQLKEELDYPAKEISAALKTLQEAFLVYEDQRDTDWDTGWFAFSTEWFDLKEEKAQEDQALREILINFIAGMVFATFEQIRSWSQLPQKLIHQTLAELQQMEAILQVEVEQEGVGFMVTKDVNELEWQNREQIQSVHMLDKSDFLVRAYTKELQEKYKGLEVLQYLFIDGQFHGAVLGHWRIGPYDIEDIFLDNEDHAHQRRDEIIEAVRRIYSPDTTVIKKFNGIPV